MKKNIFALIMVISSICLFGEWNPTLPNTIEGTIISNGIYDNQALNGSFDYWKINNNSYGDITIALHTNNIILQLVYSNSSDSEPNQVVILKDSQNYLFGESVSSTITLEASKFYYIKVTSVSSTLNYSFTLSGTATLPVELSSFNAFLTNTNNVSLNWTSQSESNMVGYNVFRANSNQQSDAVKINPAIIAATNTSSEQNYSFTDHSIDAGDYYYWLQSVEANNETAFHGPVHVSYNPGTGMPDPEYQYKHFLKGAYPNPFNPSTSIQYELAEAANVEIVIFNAKGQKVRTFNQSHNNKGTYNVVWDGLDENGTSVNSGVYFYRMTAGKSVQSKKMLLVK